MRDERALLLELATLGCSDQVGEGVAGAAKLRRSDGVFGANSWLRGRSPKVESRTGGISGEGAGVGSVGCGGGSEGLGLGFWKAPGADSSQISS